MDIMAVTIGGHFDRFKSSYHHMILIEGYVYASYACIC